MRSTRIVDGERLAALRGKRSRNLIAFELQKRGHATDAKTIWRWENGRNQPSGRVLHDLAEVLGSSVDAVYTDDEDEEAASMDSIATDLMRAVDRLVDAKLSRSAA